MVWNILYLYRYLVRWSILTSFFFIFELGWNHQLALYKQIYIYIYTYTCIIIYWSKMMDNLVGPSPDAGKSPVWVCRRFLHSPPPTPMSLFSTNESGTLLVICSLLIYNYSMYIYIYTDLPNTQNIWFWVLVEHLVWKFPHIVLYPAAPSGLAVSWLMSLHGEVSMVPWVGSLWKFVEQQPGRWAAGSPTAITREKKGKWSEPNLQGIMFHVNL